MGDALKGYFTDLMRKWKQDPSLVLPELKRVIVTRWLSNPYTLGAYSYPKVGASPKVFKQMGEPLPSKNDPRLLFAGKSV